MVSKKTDSCLGRIISRYKFNEFSVSLPSRMGKRKYDICESEQADDIRSFCNEIIKTLVDAVPRRVGCDQKDCYDFNEVEYGYEVIVSIKSKQIRCFDPKVTIMYNEKAIQ